jgi:hypothetical protein
MHYIKLNRPRPTVVRRRPGTHHSNQHHQPRIHNHFHAGGDHKTRRTQEGLLRHTKQPFRLLHRRGFYCRVRPRAFPRHLRARSNHAFPDLPNWPRVADREISVKLEGHFLDFFLVDAVGREHRRAASSICLHLRDSRDVALRHCEDQWRDERVREFLGALEGGYATVPLINRRGLERAHVCDGPPGLS